MNGRLTRPLRFLLERWVQKGILHQLVLMASLIVVVAVLGGLAAWSMTPRFASAPEAIWWAFLRLTDPGYLGDDEGAALRVISTVVTVLGYVIFMGSLIAIMTQWLAATLRRLESGLTPIAMRNHVVVLGWTTRTPEIVLKLLDARGRLERFLERSDARRLRVVVQSDEVDARRRQELRDHLGEHWNESRILLRSGSTLRTEDLQRLDLGRASAILVPGADFELGGAEQTDTRVVKTLLTVSSALRAHPGAGRPLVVAEVFDSSKVPLARKAAEAEVEVVASDRIVGRLLAQSVQHRGLARVLFGLMSYRHGHSLYVRNFPELAGLAPPALVDVFPEAVVLGLVRHRGDGLLDTDLDPTTTATLERDDLLVLLAPSYDHCHVGAGRPRAVTAGEPLPAAEERRDRRILVLGWSHKIATLVAELAEDPAGRFELTLLSRFPVEERERQLERISYPEDRVRVSNVVGDYAIEGDLARLDPQSFDHVLLLGSSWVSSAEEADARTVLGYVLLTSLLEDAPDGPEILVELLDAENAELFEDSPYDVLVSPRFLSRLLAHVALRRELNAVFEALFSAGGSNLELRPVGQFGLAERTVCFPEVQTAALEHGVAALGILVAAGPANGFHLNPERGRGWTLETEDRLIVLAAGSIG